MDLTAPSAEQIPEPDAEPDLTVLVALGDFLEVEHSEGPAVEDGNEGDALAVVDDLPSNRFLWSGVPPKKRLRTKTSMATKCRGGGRYSYNYEY